MTEADCICTPEESCAYHLELKALASKPVDNHVTRLRAQVQIARKELASMVSGYDHEEDAHRHRNGACRVCNAERALAEMDQIAQKDRNRCIHDVHGEDCRVCYP